jgi:PAS domain S-box-containing protein
MNEKRMFAKGIKAKVVAWVLATIFVTVVIVSVTVHVWVKTLLKDVLVADRKEMAELMATSVAGITSDAISDIAGYLSSPTWRSAVDDTNQSYRGKSPDSIVRELLDVDKRWIAAADDDPLLARYLGTPLSFRMKKLEEAIPSLGEIFLTDEYGGLVAASRRTEDFYQADEDWWIRAYNQGAGALFIGDIEEDVSAGIMSLTIAVPVMDDNGKVSGVCKAVYDAEKFFSPIGDFRIGETGYATLVNKDGYVIFRLGRTSKTLRICKDSDIEKTIRDKGAGTIIVYPQMYPGETFLVGADVFHPYLSGWAVFVDQDSAEVFMPMRKLLRSSMLVLIVLVMIAIPTAYLIGRSIVFPVEQLNRASKRFASGDLEYRINSTREDEIGELARAMDSMADDLKGTYVSIDELNKEVKVRERTEVALRESEARYKTIYESSKDAIMTLKPYGHFLGGNPATIEMFKCSGEKEFVRQTPWDISPEYQPDGRLSSEKANEMMSIAMERGSNFFEWRHKRVSGEDFPATVLLTRMEVDGETIIQATVRDITDQKRAQEAVMETVKLKSDFTAMVSHELRTPLTAIREGIDMVRDGSMGAINEEQKDFLDTAQRNVDRLTRLINDVLDFSKLDAGKMEMDMSENDISWAINEVVSVQKAHALEKSIYLRQAIEDNIPRARFNFDRIIQVITNLVNNALKFTDKGGITVSASSDSGKIKVVVEDTGEGIRGDDIDNVFEEFRQVEDKNTRKTGGAGLGLAISRKIIEEHHGDIWIESEYGKGTKAIFTIPI